MVKIINLRGLISDNKNNSDEKDSKNNNDNINYNNNYNNIRGNGSQVRLKEGSKKKNLY